MASCFNCGDHESDVNLTSYRAKTIIKNDCGYGIVKVGEIIALCTDCASEGQGFAPDIEPTGNPVEDGEDDDRDMGIDDLAWERRSMGFVDF